MIKVCLFYYVFFLVFFLHYLLFLLFSSSSPPPPPLPLPSPSSLNLYNFYFLINGLIIRIIRIIIIKYKLKRNKKKKPKRKKENHNLTQHNTTEITFTVVWCCCRSKVRVPLAPLAAVQGTCSKGGSAVGVEGGTVGEGARAVWRRARISLLTEWMVATGSRGATSAERTCR